MKNDKDKKIVVYVGQMVRMKITSGLDPSDRGKVVEATVTDIKTGMIRVEYRNENGTQRVLLDETLEKLDWPYAEYKVLKKG